jgi:HEAT repeat protein
MFRRATLCCSIFAMLGGAQVFATEPTLDQMLKSATSSSGKEQYTAIDDLGERHAHAAQVVPKLIKMLDDKDPKVRWRTARTLGEYRGQAKEAVEGIRKLLGDKDPIVQYHAAVALGKLEDTSDETIEALVKVATSKDQRVSRAGIEAIRHLKPGPKRVAEVLGKALKSSDPAVTVQALEAIVAEGKKALPFLKEALQNPETAYVACAAIEQLGPDAAETVPELTVLVEKSKHSQMQIQLLLALAAIGPDAASAEPQIKSELESSKDATVPVAAAYALGSIGAKNSDAELKKAAATKNNEFLQMMAIWAIAKLHPDDDAAKKAAIEKLTQALKSDKPAVRSAAAKSLQSLHAPPEEVAPYLVKLVNDPNPQVQTNAVDAIASLGDSVVPRVSQALSNPQLRGPAIRVLKELGPKASGAVDSLIAAADKADPKVQTDIQMTLAAIGPAAAPATEMLVKSLGSKNANERESALLALRKIGPGAKAAVKPLLELAKTDDSFESAAAAWALARIAPDDKEVVDAIMPKLEKTLKSADEQERMDDVEALSDMKAAGHSADAELEKAAKDDSSPMVRAAAEEAVHPKAAE